MFMRALGEAGWSESKPSEDDGLFHITADEWDADAFLILLNIMHLRNRQIPRKLPLEMLAKIAVLVDYYECGEAVEMFTSLWIDHLKNVSALPLTYCRDLVLWIWVSWVFDIGDYFFLTTAAAIKEIDGTLRALDLPIPSRVIGKSLVILLLLDELLSMK
tara:strand:- start:12 stop:491 length:480 start_codon:yes stop_codon:yes gene_type:complete